MRWIEAKVVFEAADMRLAEELICNLFLESGIQGVVVEDPDEEPDEEWGEDAVARPAAHAVIGFFAEGPDAGRNCRNLEKNLGAVASMSGIQTKIAYRPVDEEDWAESWKAFFWPEKISDSIVIKPTWRAYEAAPADRVIEIDPGMAFGTGTHPTTRLCIRMLEKHLKADDSVLDIGTGSGILLIAAALLGAGSLTGVDNDPVAVAIAEKNLRINHVEDRRFSIASGNLADAVSGRFDMVVANILSEVIIRLSGDVLRLLEPGGRFICSGIVDNHADAVEAALADAGLLVTEKKILEHWVVFSSVAG